MPPKQRISFECPLCQQPVSNNTFADHCCVKHNIMPKEQCPWCLGHTHHGGDKHANACFELFMKALPRAATPSPLLPESADPVPFDLTLMAKEVVVTDPDLLPLKAIPLELRDQLHFQCPHLNLAAATVQLFLEGGADWFHLMIREPAWNNFRESAKEAPIQLLPFSCYCKGGGGAVHRHFIVKFPLKSSQSVWKRQRPFQKYIRKRKIESPRELVEVLDSLSQEESACDFTFREGGGTKTRNHYNLAASLPRQHPMVLSFLWDGGIVDWIHRRYASVEASVLAPAAFLSDGLWVVKFRDLPGLEANVVLPVSRCFRPGGNSPTGFYLLLDRGRTFFFEKGSDEEEEEEGEEDWFRDQVKGGNVVLNLIGDNLYYPTLYQQKCISSIRPNMEDIEHLQKIYEENESTIGWLQDSVNKLKSTNKSLKRKCVDSEKELKKLQHKHIKYLEQENDHWRMKFENFKKQ